VISYTAVLDSSSHTVGRNIFMRGYDKESRIDLIGGLRDAAEKIAGLIDKV
jgi:hypothetical protein